MPKQWSEIAGTEAFQALPDDDKDVVRESYFEKVVAPAVAPEHLESTRSRFNTASGYRSRALPEGVTPSEAGAGRGAGPTPEQQDEQQLAPPVRQTDSAAPAPPAAPTPRRGTTRGVRPFVGGDQRTGFQPGDTGGGRGRINTAEDFEADRLNNGSSTVSPMQTSRDMLSGFFQVRSLGEGAKAYAGAVDYNAIDKTLQDLDAIDAGQQPTATAPKERNHRGEVQFGQPNSIVQNYRLYPPEDRAKVRAELQSQMAGDREFVAKATRAVKEYQDKAGEETGKLPDFTDVKTLKGFTEWAVRNGVATTPTMAASMLGALAGVPGLLATGGTMAVGDMNSARGMAALEQSDPNRFHSADRIADAQAAQDDQIVRHQAENAGTTAAFAVPYAALDFLGPAGTLASGGAKGLAKKGIGQIVKKGAQEIGEEAVNEGGQEVVNVASDMLAGERSTDVTQGDVNRVVNSAAAGALMGGAGHAGNVIKEGAGDAYAKAREKLAGRKTPMVEGKPNAYTEAADQGFVVNPPMTSDPATVQRSKTTAIFSSLASQYGIPSAAIARAKTTADGMPLEDIGPFYARFVEALQKRGGVVKPVDAHALVTLEAGPVEPAPEEGETKLAKTGTELTKTGTATAPAPVKATDENADEDFTGLSDAAPIDIAAHVAATSPQNELVEPTDAQKEAGNYKLGHHKIAGLDVSIENPQGSVRRARADAPVQWETEMQHHYGYIRGTVGQDGDHIDTFIKPGTPDDFAGQVFVVDQLNKDGTPDEHKVMMGFDTEAEARAAYLSNYQKGWKGLGAITAAPVDDFKTWLRDGDTTKPFAKGAPDGRAQPDVQPAAEVAAQPAAGGRDQPAGSSRAVGRAPDDSAGPQRGRPAAAAPVAGVRAPAAVGHEGQGAAAVAPGGRVIGTAGPMPNRATPIELRPNADGTLTPWHEGRELLDFETAEPISLPADTTDAGAIDAVKAAGAFGRRTKFFAAKASTEEAKPEAAPAPASAPAGIGRSATASRTARRRIAFKPDTDTVLQALAKMGGLTRADAKREFGLRPEELAHAVNAGNLRGFPFRAAGGMTIDSAITQLREAGYFAGVAEEDLRHTLEAAIHDELGGGKTLSTEGQMAEAERLTAEDAAERQALMETADLSEDELAALTDDDIDALPTSSNVTTEAFLRAMGFSEQEIADETAKQASTAQAGPDEDRAPAGAAARGAGGPGGAEARPGAAAGRAGAAARSLSDAEAFASDYKAFDGRTVEQQVSVADSGQTFQLRHDAARALRELDARQQALVKLKDCLGGTRA